MKNRTFYLIALLFVVLGFASWWLITRSDKKVSSNTADRQFAIENEDDIHKIFMVRKGGQAIQLEKKEGVWYVNDRYIAFLNPIQNLMYALTKVSVKSIPPKAAYEVIMKDLSEVGLKVEIYGKDQEKLKTYYVGGVTDDETGVYFLMEGSRQPYIMYLDKKVANVRQRYELALDDWRDRALIPLRPEDISGIKVEYPYEPERSFIIEQTENKYKLISIAHPESNTEMVKSKFLRSYVDNIPLAMIEAYKNTHPAKTQISAKTPYCRISVARQGVVDSFFVNLYPVNEEQEEPVDLTPEFLKQRKFFRFFANRSDGDFLIMQIQQIDMILKDYQDMIKG
ncbi:MAG: DUF4340 domain-containing protein [Saprospiraceae bacterium]|nr:DUF4340 domain-containing protein [Saprospiraceae bacterium]